MPKPILSRRCLLCDSEIDDFRRKTTDPKKVGRITNRHYCRACREDRARQRGYRLSKLNAQHPGGHRGGRPLNPAPWERMRQLAGAGLGVSAIANQLTADGFRISASTVARRLSNGMKRDKEIT